MMIVTIAALVMAASLGWFAYRLLQDEQRRSDARVALLTAALDGDTSSTWDPPVRPVGFVPRTTVPTPSPAIPASRPDVPAVPALIYLEDDARPVSAFRSESEGRFAVPGAFATDVAADNTTPSRVSGLFADVPDARRRDARGAIALAGVVLVGLLALGYLWFGRPAPATTQVARAHAGAQTGTATVTTPGGMPLELLSLSHEQRPGLLVVRGLVRNPVSGSDRIGIVASVMLLDQAGGFLGSGRAPLEATRLHPGDDVGFAVTLPSHKDVRRYRVTFRGVDGALVPHADRRVARP